MVPRTEPSCPQIDFEIIINHEQLALIRENLGLQSCDHFPDYIFLADRFQSKQILENISHIWC